MNHTSYPFRQQTLQGFRLYLIAALLFTFSAGLTCKPTQTVDLPASDLDVTITFIDVDPSPSDGKVPVIVQFFSNGSYVKLNASSTVTCNGVTLTDNGIGYAERVNLLSPGGTYAIRHTRSGVTTTANVTVPARPQIISPASGATVTRTASLTITYVPGTGAAIRGGAGDNSTGLTGTTQPDNGTFTGLNVTSLSAGPGRINITRDFENMITTGFKTTKVKYSVTNSRPVTWN